MDTSFFCSLSSTLMASRENYGYFLNMGEDYMAQQKKIATLVLLGALTLAFAGCSKKEKHAATGGLIGAASGAAIGGIAGGGGGAVAGGLVGAGVGALVGSQVK